MTGKINICMFSYYFPPQYSGSAIQAVNLAREMRSRGIDTFFCTVNHDDSKQAEDFEGFRVYRLNEGRGKHKELVLWKNMWSILKNGRNKWDIIHSHGAYLRNSIIGPLSRHLGKKSLVKISLLHNDLYGLGRGKSGWLHRKFISRIDRYVSISGKITKELRDYKLPEDRIREIPNGVDTNRFYPVSNEDKRALRKKYDLPLDRKVFLYVGVIDERKNVKWLIDEWETVTDKHDGYLMVVGPVSRDDGDGTFYESLRAREKTLRGRIGFLQYTDSIEDLYRLADVFVLPSTNEGMPNVVLEAMASGLPCLVSSTSGTEDLIDGDNGILFNSKDQESFHRGMERLHDPSLRSAMGMKARESINARYSIKSVADQYIRLYREMLGGEEE